MFIGEEKHGQVWTDLLRWQESKVKIGDDGQADFPCPGVSVAVQVNKDAEGRKKFPVDFDADIYKVDKQAFSRLRHSGAASNLDTMDVLDRDPTRVERCYKWVCCRHSEHGLNPGVVL